MTKELPSTCRTKNEEPAVEPDCTGPLCGSTECGGDHHPLCSRTHLPVPAKGPTHQPVAWRVHPFDYGIGSKGVYAITQIGLQVEAWERKGWKVEPLYTKGGAA